MYSRKHYLGLLEEAKTALAGMDIVERARVCGFLRGESGRGGPAIVFESLGERYRLDAETLDIVSLDSGRPMRLQMRILALHYLSRAADVPLTGRLMPLKTFPDLELYGPVIRRRSEDILAARFGARPDLLKPVAERLGGSAVDMGDAGCRLPPLPRVPVVIVVYEAEPGLPADAVVMYDSCAGRLMHPEDMVVLAELLAHKMSNMAGRM